MRASPRKLSRLGQGCLGPHGWTATRFSWALSSSTWAAAGAEQLLVGRPRQRQRRRPALVRPRAMAGDGHQAMFNCRVTLTPQLLGRLLLVPSSWDAQSTHPSKFQLTLPFGRNLRLACQFQGTILRPELLAHSRFCIDPRRPFNSNSKPSRRTWHDPARTLLHLNGGYYIKTVAWPKRWNTSAVFVSAPETIHLTVQLQGMR